MAAFTGVLSSGTLISDISHSLDTVTAFFAKTVIEHIHKTAKPHDIILFKTAHSPLIEAYAVLCLIMLSDKAEIRRTNVNYAYKPIGIKWIWNVNDKSKNPHSNEWGFLVIHRGFEPRTPWLKVKCSANWANESFGQLYYYINLITACQEKFVGIQNTF